MRAIDLRPDFSNKVFATKGGSGKVNDGKGVLQLVNKRVGSLFGVSTTLLSTNDPNVFVAVVSVRTVPSLFTGNGWLW